MREPDEDNAAFYAGCADPGESEGPAIDCDDGEPATYPGAAEVCDGLDNDCDGTPDEGLDLTCYADSDGDGYGDPAVSTDTCAPPAGYTPNDDDCNDSDASISPSGTEVCNGIDDDCDGATDGADATLDPGSAATWYTDLDGDGYADVILGGDDDGDAGQLYYAQGSAGLSWTVAALFDVNPSAESSTNSAGASRPRLWDWDDDGSLDLLLVQETDPTDPAAKVLDLYLNLGGFSFDAGTEVLTEGEVSGYVFAVPGR